MRSTVGLALVIGGLGLIYLALRPVAGPAASTTPAGGSGAQLVP